MPVKGPAGTPGLSLKDHEALATQLLLARSRLARVSAQVRADGAWRWLRPVIQSLEAAIRAVDQARDQLAGALAEEHRHLGGLAKFVYYPVEGREEAP